MPTVEFEGRPYLLMQSSNLDRDGMALELDDLSGGQELVLSGFYSDADGRMTLTAFREDLPMDLVAWFIDSARTLLPPADRLPWLPTTPSSQPPA